MSACYVYGFQRSELHQQNRCQPLITLLVSMQFNYPKSVEEEKRRNYLVSERDGARVPLASTRDHP
eukprot:9191196-Pyramimonas_sp.AAC.1